MTHCANLTGVSEDTLHGPVFHQSLWSHCEYYGRGVHSLRHSQVEVCIVENDGGRFAAQFQRYALQVALRGILLDPATRGGATGEGNLLNSHVQGQQLACLCRPVDDVDGAWWKALFDQWA